MWSKKQFHVKTLLLPNGCLNIKYHPWFSFLRRFNLLLNFACLKGAKKEDRYSEKWNLLRETFLRWMLKDQHVQINKGGLFAGSPCYSFTAFCRVLPPHARFSCLLLVYISKALGWLRNPSSFNENPIVSESMWISVSPFLCGCNTFQTVWAALCNLGLSCLLWLCSECFFQRDLCGGELLSAITR